MSAERFPGAARLARRKLIRRLTLIGVLVALLIASALLWPRQQQGPLRVATATGASAEGVVRGPLRAQRSGDQVCFRVTTDDGAALLRLPPGWSADEHLDLLDGSGATVAAPGETVLVTGEPGEVGAIAGCPGTGRVWSATIVALAR